MEIWFCWVSFAVSVQIIIEYDIFFLKGQMENDTKEDAEMNGEESYNRVVKLRLREWQQELKNQGYELDFSMLATKMQLDYNINTTDQKLRAMFADNERKLQLAELVALCHMLRIPLQNLCELPNAPGRHFDLETAPWIRRMRGMRTTEDTKGIALMRDPHYSGRFYCYYFYPKHFPELLEGNPVDQMKIEQAEINIAERDGSLFVTMDEKTNLVDFWGKRVLDEIELQGRLYLVERTHQAYCFLADQMGKRVVFLMFDYMEYSKEIMYYRTAAMLTISRNRQSTPLFQKMAMFRVRQDLSDPKTETVIRGVLALNTGDILVKESVFESMKAADPVLGEINCPVEQYRTIPVSEVLKRNPEDHQSFEDRRYRLMQLRRASEFQAHEIVWEDEEHALYMKRMQRRYRDEAERDL